MGKETGIAWTAHTHNGIRGCVHATLPDGTKSRACLSPCYAEVLAGRNPRTLGTWGPMGVGTRSFGGDSYWKQAVAWNREAAEAGVPVTTFSASLADWFEGRTEMCDTCRGGEVPGGHALGVAPDPTRRCPDCGGPGWREYRDGVREDYLPHLARLWDTIHATPFLRWQILTKRPWNALRYAQANGWPPNAWAGITAEGMPELADRWATFRQIPAAVRFLSVEPMFDRMDLTPYLWRPCADCGGAALVGSDGSACVCAIYGKRPGYERTNEIAWVIVGGNSAAGAAHLDIDAVRGVIRQCDAAGAIPFIKQLGWAWARAAGSTNRAGSDPAEWPADLRVQRFPSMALLGVSDRADASTPRQVPL